MFELFSELMSGFSTDNPLEYTCCFLLFVILCGVFFRFLYSLFKPY